MYLAHSSCNDPRPSLCRSRRTAPTARLEGACCDIREYGCLYRKCFRGDTLGPRRRFARACSLEENALGKYASAISSFLKEQFDIQSQRIFLGHRAAYPGSSKRQRHHSFLKFAGSQIGFPISTSMPEKEVTFATGRLPVLRSSFIVPADTGSSSLASPNFSKQWAQTSHSLVVSCYSECL